MKVRWGGIALTLTLVSLGACGGGSGNEGKPDASPNTDAAPANPFELTGLNAMLTALKTNTAGAGDPGALNYLVIPKGNLPFWQRVADGAGKAGRDIGVRVELIIPATSGGGNNQAK